MANRPQPLMLRRRDKVHIFLDSGNFSGVVLGSIVLTGTTASAESACVWHRGEAGSTQGATHRKASSSSVKGKWEDIGLGVTETACTRRTST